MKHLSVNSDFIMEKLIVYQSIYEEYMLDASAKNIKAHGLDVREIVSEIREYLTQGCLPHGITRLTLDDVPLHRIDELTHIDNLTYIYLNNCGLQYIPDLCHMRGLRYFSANYNSLRWIPSFKGLTELHYVSFNNNKLTYINLYKLHTTILQCRCNLLTEITLYEGSIVILDCRNNKIAKLNNLDTSGLSRLQADNNNLAELEFNPFFTRVHICNNKFTKLPKFPNTLVHLACVGNVFTPPTFTEVKTKYPLIKVYN